MFCNYDQSQKIGKPNNLKVFRSKNTNGTIIYPVVSVSELTWLIIVETKLKICNVQYYNDYIYVLGFEQI
jgi:hypothetical protein